MSPLHTATITTLKAFSFTRREEILRLCAEHFYAGMRAVACDVIRASHGATEAEPVLMAHRLERLAHFVETPNCLKATICLPFLDDLPSDVRGRVEEALTHTEGDECDIEEEPSRATHEPVDLHTVSVSDEALPAPIRQMLFEALAILEEIARRRRQEKKPV